jgi:anti-sigma factor RsiW
MSCQETHVLLHAFVDDELDPVRSLSVQSHLDACPDCARKHAAYRSLRAALRDEALYFRSPEGFESRVRAALGSQGAIERRAGWLGAVGALPRMRWAWLPAGAAAALLAVTVITIWRFEAVPPGPLADDLLGREVVASHVRSLMASHLTDVPSSDQHTVKPWFNGRLDFSPPVKDLAGEGFALVGGRLDYLAGRPVAALVYQRRLHVINLMVWPASGEPDRSLTAAPHQGYHVLHWTLGGMSYWAVSDLNENEMKEFVRLVQR